MTHFHIRWTKTGLLDWEPHSTRSACEESAKRLALGGESYIIEECDSSCLRCRLAKEVAVEQDERSGSA